MQQIVIKNGVIHTLEGVIHGGWVAINQGIITALGEGSSPIALQVVDAQKKAVLPGFIDLHVHGALGYDTMQAEPHALQVMARHYASHGVTSFLAGTITHNPAATLKALKNIARCVGSIKQGATLLGAYLEGPCISTHAKGAHTAEFIRRANPAEYNQWFELEVVKQMTIAPEFPENSQLIKECVSRGITPCIGHTAADYDQVIQAALLGALQSTHTFNAMTGIHHRMPGAAGAVLTHDAIVCELIADLVHVHPAIVKLAIRAKGTDKIVLITDAESGTGLEPGKYTVNGRDLHITSEGVYLSDGTLAGSLLTMDKALRNSVQAAELTLQEAWPMTSYNAARQLGIEHRKGTIAVNCDADVVIIDPDDYSVAMTMVHGEVVYTHNPKNE